MKGSKTLTEVLNFVEELPKGLLVINAPCGSGKTYFAVHKLSDFAAKSRNRVLYLIDTLSGKQEVLKYEKYTVPYQGMTVYGEEKIVVMTYSIFGSKLDKFDIKNDYDLIICDELHSLPSMSAYNSKTGKEQKKAEEIDQRSNTLKAREALAQIFLDKIISCVAITATPNSIFRHFKSCGLSLARYDASAACIAPHGSHRR